MVFPSAFIRRWALYGGTALLLGVAMAGAACGVLRDPGLIAYSSGQEGQRDILAIRADGTQGITVIDHPADDFSPRWSADGKRLAFLSDRLGNVEVFVGPADGSDARRATNTSVAESSLTWSPDGERLAYLSPDKEGRTHVFLVEIRTLTPNRLTFGGVAETDLTWSPDGRWIAFVALDEAGEPVGIFLRNPDGVNRIRVTNAPDRSPTWSPDSESLAFVSERDGNREIYVVDVSQAEEAVGESVRLTVNAASDYGPAWSPDGDGIAFLSDRDGNVEVYIVAPDGDELQRLTTNGVEERGLVWGREGRLAFVSELADRPHIFVMKADGSDQRQVTFGNTPNDQPDW